jgi:type III secretion protein U
VSEKTEEPTDKKIRDARKQGNVAHSKDFTQAVLVLALLGYLISAARGIAADMGEMLLLPASLMQIPFETAANTLIVGLTREAVMVLAPFIGLVIFLGVFTEMLQVGVLFAFEALKPSGKKLDVAANLKNMFGAKSWIEFGKSILKVVILTTIVTMILKHEIGGLITVPRGGIEAVAAAMGSLLTSLFLQSALAYGVIAAFDLIFQRRRWRKDLMMTKDEVKREYKEMEGDQHIKHKRKQLHKELLSSDSVAATRKANAVVTNPTHLAVAIRYVDEEETPLPIVVAKGEGALAKRMVAAAREAGIPVLQNIPLARALTAQATIDRYIPADLIEPMAEFLQAIAEMNEGSP